MAEARARLWTQAAAAGAAAGVLAEVMVLRLNPEVPQHASAVLVGAPLWAAWGALGVGLPLLALGAALRRLRRRPDAWLMPELAAVAYLAAGVMCQVNADLHEFLVSSSALRVLAQDAVAWGVGLALALVGGVAVRRAGAPWRLRVGLGAVLIMLPLARMLLQPTPPGLPLEVAARPIGAPTQRLVVVGIEGLDGTVLLGRVDDNRAPQLAALVSRGCWGPLTPHRPHLRRSAWTSTATGSYPGRHGVKSKRGWLLPWLPGQPLRLLPWTPQGSRLILPWGLAREVTPPAASVPPLWERLRASGVPTAVVDWPGIWGAGVSLDPWAPEERQSFDAGVRSSLEWALEPFPDRSAAVWRAVGDDRGRVAAALAALAGGAGDVWVHLEGLAVARSGLEPLRARHTREREVVELALQLVDDQLGAILAAAGSDATVAVVAPYGLAPPTPWERLRRLLGIGGAWRVSPETNPDGALLLAGPGVAAGRRFERARLADVAPTLCYLLGLPTAQYMEGGIIVDAIEPEFLATHPLRVAE
ncbi:MAG TPA: alkaline phosphatase family protein [Thermoanaerobaculales bacterium]|nr:alkaline phosphatase family protein [Thermoanaerobaculales bacterium]HQL28621.1 alkaline phosphatase family protein [Thermoanaerobaculales bacterium]